MAAVMAISSVAGYLKLAQYLSYLAIGRISMAIVAYG